MKAMEEWGKKRGIEEGRETQTDKQTEHEMKTGNRKEGKNIYVDEKLHVQTR